MIEVNVYGDGDILGRVNPGSHFRYVVWKQFSEQLTLSGFRRTGFLRLHCKHAVSRPNCSNHIGVTHPNCAELPTANAGQ